MLFFMDGVKRHICYLGNGFFGCLCDKIIRARSVYKKICPYIAMADAMYYMLINTIIMDMRINGIMIDCNHKAILVSVSNVLKARTVYG